MATKQELQKELLEKVRANCDFFFEFSDAEILSLLKLVQVEKIGKGKVIFSKNDIASSFYIIIEGKVEIFVPRTETAHVLAKLDDGKIFGEMGILYGQTRTASARTMADTILFNISEKIFEENNNFELLSRIYKGLARIVTMRASEMIKKQRDDFAGTM